MARRLGQYDSELQMFAEPTIEIKDINIERLRFLRWMLLQGKETGEGYPCGAPSGEIVDFLKAKAEREAEVTAAA